MDIEKEIKELFSNAEAHLLESREKFGEGYEDFILRNVKLEPGDKLLDVGCGVGQLVKLISDNFNNVNVVGLDSSEKLIKKAREMTNLDFVVGDAYDIPYSNNSFDVVICQTLLIHVLEPQSVIEEMKRVAKNDGRVITIESLVHTDGSNQFVPNPGKEKLQKRLEAFKYEFEKKQEAGMDMFIARKLPWMFQELGFSNINIDSYNIVNFSEESKIREEEKFEETDLSAYDQMLLEIGYDKSKLEELHKLERKYEKVAGEFSLDTLLSVSGKPNK